MTTGQFTFEYRSKFEALLERSPARMLKYVLNSTPWGFFPYGQYGLTDTWWNRNKRHVDVQRVISSSVWGNFCALYALYISRYAPGMKRRRWDPNLFKQIFEGQLLLESDPTLRRSKILIKGTGFSFFKWLKSLGEPADEMVYDLFETKPKATHITVNGTITKYSHWGYRFFDPKEIPTKQIVWAESYFPNQWLRIGPSITYYSYPGLKLINRYSIGLHPNGYFIKNYARYRYNPAGGWSNSFAHPFETGDEAFNRAWQDIPYITEEVREVERPLSSWQIKRAGLPAGSTETIERKVLVDTRDDTIIERRSSPETLLKYRDDLNAQLKDSPRKKSMIEWKRSAFSDPSTRRGSGTRVLDTAQYPALPPEIYFSINYANGLFQHLPKRISNEKIGDSVYYNLTPSFRK